MNVLKKSNALSVFLLTTTLLAGCSVSIDEDEKNVALPDASLQLGPPLSSLSPMGVGATFQYSFTATGCGPGSTLNTEVKGLDTDASETIYTLESVATCNSFGTPYELAPEISLFSMNENRARWKLESTQTWRTIMRSPVENGRSFETDLVLANAPETFEWIAVDSIDVAAGSFTDCWKTRSDVASIVDERTYCLGVGLVHRTLSSEGGLTGTTVEELTSYEL